MVGDCKNNAVIKTVRLLLKIFIIFVICFQTDMFGMDLKEEHKCHKMLDSLCPENVYEQFSGPPFHSPLGEEYYIYTLFNDIGRYTVISNSLTQQNLLSTFGKIDVINDTIIFSPEISVYIDKKSDNILNIREIESIEAEQKYDQELKMKGVRVDENRIDLFIDMRQKVSHQKWAEADSLAIDGDPTTHDFFNQLFGFTAKMAIFKLSSTYNPM